MSNAKLGLLVFWPTFWTGFPIKMGICLLLLAGHPPHVGEDHGLAAVILGAAETVFIISFPKKIVATFG